MRWSRMAIERPLAILLFAATLTSACDSIAGDDLAGAVDIAIQRAGDNAQEIRRALDQAPDDQKYAVRFLVAHMPQRDLTSLSADFLLKNVRVAYQAWHEAPWKDQISEQMFLNEILPFASINERRDDWREDFYKRLKPLVAEARSPAEAAGILNQKLFDVLGVHFSRQRPKPDQSPYESMEAGMASCTGMSVLLVDACRAVGVPARFVGTPLWADLSGNHSWVEIWDGDWHFTGAGEPQGGQLDRAWFVTRAETAQKTDRLHAIYATSFQQTPVTFPLSWSTNVDYVYAVNVTDRYASPGRDATPAPTDDAAMQVDVEASLHALDQLNSYLRTPPAERPALDATDFAQVSLTRADAQKARDHLWRAHVSRLQETHRQEMEDRVLTNGTFKLPFFYSVNGQKPAGGRSLYISLHGGGGAPTSVNEAQYENQKHLYVIEEGIYLAPRAPTDTWNMWHQDHIDGFFDRLIENLIVFEDVDPDRVYLLGYSAGGDGVYRLAPRMADRYAAASMMAGHPGDASALNLRNTPFSIHMGAEDAAYNRNQVARRWGQDLDALQKEDPEGYIHWTEIYEGKGHGLNREEAAALRWMATFTRNPLPRSIVWRQDRHARFYWLSVPELRPGGVIRARMEDQAIHLETDATQSITIRVNDSMLDLDRVITVTSSGNTLFKGHVQRTISTLAKTIAERGDPSSIFSAAWVVTVPEAK